MDKDLISHSQSYMINTDQKELISVIMPVYNSGKYLGEAINSILNQTYSHFEFIIIDDGSIDNSQEIIESFTDERIRYIKNTSNKGIVYSLNKAIELSTGDYIARMDSDDISMPERFECQINEFRKNSKLVLCGTWYKSIYKNRFLSYNKVPVTSDQIKAQLLFSNAVCHPSVMIKKSVFKDDLKYLKEDFNCEDFGLWSRMVELGEFYNIPKYLLKYRIHDTNISNSNKSLRAISVDNIKAQNFNRQLNMLEEISDIVKYGQGIDEMIYFANITLSLVSSKSEEFRCAVTTGLFRFLVSKIGLLSSIKLHQYNNSRFLLSELFIFIEEKFNSLFINSRKLYSLFQSSIRRI